MDAFLSWVVSNVVLAGLLAMAAFLVSRGMRNPHLAHGLWLLVLIKLLTPPIFVLETTWFQKPEPSLEEPAVPAATEPVPSVETDMEFADADSLSLVPAEDSSDVSIEESSLPAIAADSEPVPASVPARFGWKHGILLAWISGTVICAALVVLRSRQFRKLLALATPADDSLQHEVQRLSRRLGMKRCPSIFLIDAQVPPLVWGLFRRPRILLPRKLFEGFTPQERQTVLAHELAHLWRRDHLVRWIEVLAVVLFWWYPVAWWASREMRRAEEECCDALVIWTLPGARQCYGQALCKTIDFLAETRLPIPQIVGGAFGARPLKRRIEMILHENIPHRMSWKAWAAMLLIAAVALPVVAQNSPHEEQAPPQEPEAQSAEPPPALPGKEAELPTAEPPALPGKEAELPTAKPPALPGKEEVEMVSAQLKPSSDVQISSLQSGMVLKVHVTEGQAVKKGDLLVEIRNTETELRHQEALGELSVQQERDKTAELAIRQARAALVPAANKQEHTERLKQKGFVSDTQVQEAKAAAEQAQLNLEKAESEAKTAALTLSTLQKRAELAARLIEELSIKAPVDGVVLELQAKPGELIKANDPVARIVTLTPLIAEAYVQDPAGLLGKPVQVEVPTSKFVVRKFDGKITFVSPINEPVTQRTHIRCLFNNAGPDGQPLVRPGQPAVVIIPAKE